RNDRPSQKYKSEFIPSNMWGQYPGLGGQLAPEWGVRMVRNLHSPKVSDISENKPRTTRQI
ncbi:MAG: hypothetical protein K0B15_04605, partial [Lentimicrobium sp.]|nr:hypothetical protein [Lentimicrobium sp.]